MLFASTCDHYIDVPDRFDGGASLETIADVTPRARGRVIAFEATEFGHDLTTLQALRAPYTNDGGYTRLSCGARIYLDSGGTPSINLDMRVGSATSAVQFTFTENSVLITLDGDAEGAASHALPLPLDEWHYVNVWARLHGAGASWIIIFVDGTPTRLSLSDFDYLTTTATFGGGETLFTSYRWWGAGSVYGDDFLLAASEIIIGVEGYCCKPTSNGLTVEEDPGNGRWECSTGTNMYVLVDETPTPDTSDYIYASGSDYEQYFGTNAASVVPSTVSGKQTEVFAVNAVALSRGSTAQPDPNAVGFDPTEHPEWREVSPALNAGDTNGGQDVYMPGTAWRFFDGVQTTTPGSDPWTRALAVAGQVGVDANASSGLGTHLIPYENDMLIAQCVMEVYVYAGAPIAEDDDIVCIA